jgi:hypothetical protein
MRARRLRGFTLSFSLALTLAIANVAVADGPLDEARAAFSKGADLAKDQQWGAALASFERSAKLHPHAWTTYNIAVCERALGQYVLARRTFKRALTERATEADLPDATVADTKRFITEIDRLVGTLDITLEPADAKIAIDGAPLELDDATTATLLAGIAPAGLGKAPPAATFHVVLDPGTHVIVLTRDGFADALSRQAVRPGETRALHLSAERLPASLRVTSQEPNAAVAVDGIDLGITPVLVDRPPGSHHVLVRKPGFDDYEIDTILKSGQRTDLDPRLVLHKPSLFSRWWFWTGAAVIVAGAVVTTYAVTRPAPERPPLDGGGLGWAIKVP